MQTPLKSAPLLSSVEIPQPAPAANRMVVLAIILVSYVMIVLDNSIVFTGLQKIHQELGFSDAGLSWVSNAYTLTFGGFLLLGARAGDILGRRRMFVAGVVLFSVSSLAIGLAQSPAWLIAARAIQGVGAATLAPSTLSLLQINFPVGPQRTRAISYYAAAGGISASVGLVVGGIFADWLSWRVGFLINVPIGAAVVIATRRCIAETEQHSGRFDLIGALTSTVGMSALVFGIVHAAEAGWSNRLAMQSLSVGLILLALFVLAEWRAKQPIMPLRLFASRERSGAYAARVLFLGANISFFFFTTQFLQGVKGLSPTLTGLAFLPAMIINFVAAMTAPRLIRRIGSARVLAISIAINLIGMAWLSRVSVDTTYLAGLVLPMMLVGLGMGGTLGPLTASGIAGVAPEDAGAASGLVNAAHQLGSSFGLGLLIAVAAAGSAALDGPKLLAHRVGNAMFGATALLALALVVVLVLIVRPHTASRS